MASPSEERLSIGMVLVQCEDTLKTHIDVTKVADMMLKSEKADEILDKTVKKHLEKSKKKAESKYLLAVLRRLKLPGFVVFLESLEQIGDENHLTALTLIATHIPSLSLPTSPQDPIISEACKKVKRIHSDHFKPTKHPDVPPDPEQILGMMESLTLAEESPDASSQSVGTTILPSTKQPEQTEIQSPAVYSHSTQSLPQSLTSDGGVTVHMGKDGGELYSPVHGITVSIPASAVPHHVQEFELKMTASLSSTIPISSEYILCSAIVSLTTNPKIENFSDHVTVSVPHSAVSMQDDPEFYCLLSHTDGQLLFKEDTNIEADFTSKWRYFSFKTSHFTKYLAAGKTRAKATIPRRKQPERLAKLKSKSLEHQYGHREPSEVNAICQRERFRSASDPLSQSRYLPDVRFCLGMFTPLCKEGSLWKVVFLTCLDVPTGYAVMEQDALRLLGLCGVHLLDPGSQRISFIFQKDRSAIEFIPTECCSNGWTFRALKTPAIITKADMEYHTIQPRQDTSYAPHGLIYAVKKGVDAAVLVCQQFSVNGILSSYGDQIQSHNVSFTLVAESGLQYAAESFSYIFEDLYHPTSKFLSVICREISSSEVELKPDDPETTIFIAELSFCIMSMWVAVAKHLTLYDYVIKNLEKSHTCQEEAAFQMMLTWLGRSTVPCVTLQHLMDAINAADVEIHVQKLTQNVHRQKEKHFHQLSRATVAEISKRIASQWKFVGRLLGMTESDISLAASQGGAGVEGHYKLMEQTVAMLDFWGKNNGHEATLLKLKNAIHAVHQHSGHQLTDAIDFLSRPF